MSWDWVEPIITEAGGNLQGSIIVFFILYMPRISIIKTKNIRIRR